MPNQICHDYRHKKGIKQPIGSLTESILEIIKAGLYDGECFATGVKRSRDANPAGILFYRYEEPIRCC